MIRIAISGQFDHDSKIAYTYPDKSNRANPTDKDKWLESLADPRDARDFNATDIFALWRSPYGNYYAIIFPNKKDFRGGWTMITLNPGEKRFSDGNDVVSALRELKDLVLNLKWDCSKIKNADIEEIIKTLNTKTEIDTSVFPSKISKNKAYRVYDGEEELKLILQFPDQPGYNNFKRILIVPNASESKELASSNDYTLITEHPKVSYTIQQPIPKGVSVDKRQYCEGETIKVCYNKSGYQTQQHKFTADSKNNGFAEYDGYRIKLKSAEEAKIKFQRTLSLSVTSKLTNLQIQDWKVDNKSCKRDGKTSTIVFYQDESDYHISISAQGYEPTNIDITNDDLRSGSKSIKLEPELRAINITLIIKNKQEVTGTIYIHSDSQLTSEIKPNSRISINNSYISEGGKNNRNEPPKGPKKPKGSTLKPILTGALVILVGLYLFYLLYCVFCSQTPWPFNSEENVPKTEINTETDNSFPSSETYSEEESQKEENDRTYLKTNDTWKKSDLKSEAYRTFLDYILNGQIEDVINNQYSTYEDSSINGFWRTIVVNIKELKQSSEYASDIKPKIDQAMKRASDNDSINLQELANEISYINKQYKDTQRGRNSSKNETTSSIKETPKSSQKKDTQHKKTTTEKKTTKKPTSDD